MSRRLGWDDYFLRIVDDIALRGDCTRRQIGALLVDPVTHDFIQPGYNGSPPGKPGCLSDGACPRGRHYKKLKLPEVPVASPYDICATCKVPWPCAMAVAPGSSYDTGPGACIALHAEQNVIIRAGLRSRGGWMYVSDKPCDGCRKLMAGAGVTRVIWPGGSEDFTEPKGRDALRELVRRGRRPGSGGRAR